MSSNLVDLSAGSPICKEGRDGIHSRDTYLMLHVHLSTAIPTELTAQPRTLRAKVSPTVCGPTVEVHHCLGGLNVIDDRPGCRVGDN